MPLRYVVGAVLIFLAIAGASMAVYMGSQELYYTVDELVADAELYPLMPDGSLRASDRSDSDGPARVVRVRGEVDYGSVERADVGLEVRFRLAGDSASVPVVYNGIMPDTFDRADTVTVRGAVSSDGTFLADELMVQCPSKYEAAPPGEHSSLEAGS